MAIWLLICDALELLSSLPDEEPAVEPDAMDDMDDYHAVDALDGVDAMDDSDFLDTHLYWYRYEPEPEPICWPLPEPLPEPEWTEDQLLLLSILSR